MKKVFLLAAFAAATVFTSCSKDDDEKTCESCTVLGIKVEACDNGDDSVTVTTAGQSQTISGEDLGGVSAAEYVKAIKDSCPGS